MINIYNTKLKIFGEVDNFELLPEEEQENSIVVSEAIFKECLNLKSQGYDVELDDNLEIHKTLNQIKIEEIKFYKTNKLRLKRKPLLEAFDKYKSNVSFGIEIIDDITKNAILS